MHAGHAMGCVRYPQSRRSCGPCRRPARRLSRRRPTGVWTVSAPESACARFGRVVRKGNPPTQGGCVQQRRVCKSFKNQKTDHHEPEKKMESSGESLPDPQRLGFLPVFWEFHNTNRGMALCSSEHTPLARQSCVLVREGQVARMGRTNLEHAEPEHNPGHSEHHVDPVQLRQVVARVVAVAAANKGRPQAALVPPSRLHLGPSVPNCPFIHPLHPTRDRATSTII
jgi:hypothetical protein